MRVEELTTPALTVDLDVVVRNITRMQAYCDAHGLRFRPHVKTHKLPSVAQLQLDAGGIGITCQKLSEAEVMRAAGLSDIVIAFPIVGPGKPERMAQLAIDGTLAGVGDSETVVRSLARAASAAGTKIGFFVECDTGLRRAGVQTPAQAAELAELISGLPGLEFRGLLTYPTPPNGAWLSAARSLIRQRGVDVPIISGGGTNSAFRTHEITVITELRAGDYVYGDCSTISAGAMSVDDCALHVRATVVSRPTRQRAILDAGSKSLSSELGGGLGATGFGQILGYPQARLTQLSDEHGHVDVGNGLAGLEIGETVAILPNRAGGTTNMHDEVVMHRAGKVIETIPIVARGRVQ